MTEETPTIDAGAENAELLEEMLRDAESGEEPGEIVRNPIVSRGDDALAPVPMTRSQLESAQWVYVYDTVTHERSLINRNMLPTQLRKKRDDGSLAFTTRKPKELPWRGTEKCLLHPDNPNRQEYDRLGLPVCLKSHMPNAYQVRRHMAVRHKDEWAVITELEKDRKSAEERVFQQAIMARATGVTGEDDLPAIDPEGMAPREVIHRQRRARK